MVQREDRQRNVFEVLLPDGDKLWEPALRRIDAVLEDEALIDPMVEALARRRPQSRRRGRPGTPAAVVLRMLVLKHLYHWSFDELSERCGAASCIGPSAASTARACPMRRP
jgi:hypothetical protein